MPLRSAEFAADDSASGASDTNGVATNRSPATGLPIEVHHGGHRPAGRSTRLRAPTKHCLCRGLWTSARLQRRLLGILLLDKPRHQQLSSGALRGRLVARLGVFLLSGRRSTLIALLHRLPSTMLMRMWWIGVLQFLVLVLFLPMSRHRDLRSTPRLLCSLPLRAVQHRRRLFRTCDLSSRHLCPALPAVRLL